MRLRAAVSSQAEPFLTGCGFALGVGWLWFAGLGELWRERTADFLAIRAHEGLLALSFGAGCLVFGFAAEFTRREHPRFSPALAAALAHGGALLCLGLLCVADVPPEAAIALTGLAQAALGVHWLSRLLVLEPARAVTSLAWASFAALVLAGLTLAMPPGPGIAPGIAGCLAAAWIIAEKTARNAKPDAPEPVMRNGRAWEKRDFALFAALWLAFFILGAMYALPRPQAEAGPMALMAAHLAGAALAVPVLYPVFPGPIFDDKGPGRALFIVAGALCFAGFCSFFLPSFAPLGLDPASAFLEAAGLGSFAAILRRSGLAARRTHQGGVPRLAGIFCAALLAAVNTGHWACRGIMPALGVPGAMLCLAALIPALAFAAMAMRRRTEQAARRESMAASGVPAAQGELRGEVKPLSTKEQAVAALLVQGHANKKIAECLSVTENAVRWHIKNLNKKTGAADRRQLIDILTKGGLSA